MTRAAGLTNLYPLKEGASQAVTSLSTEQRHFAQGRYAGEP
jgi:hypothetical protein